MLKHYFGTQNKNEPSTVAKKSVATCNNTKITIFEVWFNELLHNVA